ncbi:diacylglycerol kinase [bacterium]|nr:diacylglycerol kinase [bacterium]
MINFKKLSISFKSAFNGLRVAIKEEQTFQVQIVVGLIVLILMFLLPLDGVEKVILILLITLVLGMELINSQIERILDFSHLGFHPKIKRIKDLSAAAVLVASLGAALGGLLILGPALLEILNI